MEQQARLATRQKLENATQAYASHSSLRKCRGLGWRVSGLGTAALPSGHCPLSGREASPCSGCALPWLPAGWHRAALEGAGASRSSRPPSALLQNSPAPCDASPAVQAEGDPGQEAAITLIQSALRAHLARAGHR